ncbi:MAG: TonB-dependent receptor [Chitinophagales bacterium]|jgi:iron complex outermembrane receptor protein|nr:TonB-dependent receptor [Chitinophagales bacterium]MBP9221066.1 TonB-dependent receptor [Chitinophagales bacterium]MBP9795709.1 TonB-dependent receptor [Chitinophagales bacterium]
MQKFIYAFSIIYLYIISLGQAQTSLTGTIYEAANHTALPGASIYFPDLKTGATSDADGKYVVNNLPTKKVSIQITFIGYEALVETIDLTNTSTKDFILTETFTEINEIVITGLSRSAELNRTPTPISVVTKNTLLQNSSTNIIDALETQPGISNISTGPAIAKPQIRGLGYNRVVVVNDGIKQEGQQWGDEHGIEIDEFSVNRIEILKGPASLMYGSDAMAGVIHFIGAPTLPDKTIKANILSNYQTNNGLIGYSGNIAGNKNGFIWDLRYSQKMAHAYQNKYDGYVLGSGFKENATNATIGLNKKWGYSHLTGAIYKLNVGLVEGERDSLTGLFIYPVAVNDSTVGDAISGDAISKSYDLHLPNQNIQHYKVAWNNSIVAGDGNIDLILAWQQNNRKEFENILDPNDYALYFKMNTINYAAHYLFPEKNKWSSSFGINGMQQESQNLGVEVLIPEYSLFDIGGFFTTKKTIGDFDISGGIRYDNRILNAREYFSPGGGEKIFSEINRNFSAVSGSIGTTYQINEKMHAKLNISRGFRSPNIAELGSNGVHEGTFRYELGNTELNPETSLQADFSFAYDGEHISFQADIFNNAINNFIYLRKINNALGDDSLIYVEGEFFQAFTYVQGDANLNGAEIILDIHPHPFHWLHFENSFSFVNATLLNSTDSTKYLPFSPAPKLISELRGDFKKINKFLGNSYIQFQVENYFAQNHIFSAYSTETKTPGYLLLNAGLGTDILSDNKVLFSLYFTVNNITDLAYQNHLSRLKYTEVNYVTGRTGVYNMGRNLSVKLNVPINIKS